MNVLHDDYIASAPEYAIPILEKIRKAMHKACPDVVETMKWSNPHYEHNGILGGVAAFKNHVNFGFWLGKRMRDPEGLLEIMGKTEIAVMRFESVDELPSQKTLVAYVEEALRLNEIAAKSPANRKARAEQPAKALSVPGDFASALRKNKTANKTFQNFSPTNRKEYIEWIHDAKREATRERRIVQSVEWIAEGKPRNWKHMKKWS